MDRASVEEGLDTCRMNCGYDRALAACALEAEVKQPCRPAERETEGDVWAEMAFGKSPAVDATALRLGNSMSMVYTDSGHDLWTLAGER